MAAPSMETRNAAYLSLKNDIGDRQREVLNALAIGPMSNKALAKFLRLPINSITGRVKELRELGLVELAYKDQDAATGRTVCVWRRSQW